MNLRKKQTGLSLPLFLFGTVFFAAGMAVGYFAMLKPLMLYWSASDWQVVDMQLLEVRLAEYSGEDSDTYEAIARYRYTLNGKTYENDRVWFGGGSDNIGSFQEDTYELLYEYYAEEEPYPGLVNPNDPNQSVLIKDMRWGMIAFVAIFPIIFGGVGGLLMFFALRMGNNQ